MGGGRSALLAIETSVCPRTSLLGRRRRGHERELDGCVRCLPGDCDGGLESCERRLRSGRRTARQNQHTCAPNATEARAWNFSSRPTGASPFYCDLAVKLARYLNLMLGTTMDIYTLHGCLAAYTILVIWPLGFAARWNHQLGSWAPHWLLQSIGTSALGTAGVIGILHSDGVTQTHQYLGIAVLIASGLQIGLGVATERYGEGKERPWLPLIHIVIGFCALGRLARHRYGASTSRC